MLKVLLKKQLMETFRNYFYNAKKNKKRSPAGVIGMFLLYFMLVFGCLGTIFTFLSVSMCIPLWQSGMDWLYFLVLSGVALLLGTFGSVFNTYAGLYLAKDNELLLSMPIPVRDIIGARIMNVWIMGTLYTAVVMVPALIVHWIITKAALSVILCGLLMFVMTSIFVLVLTCLLGWAVAKISQKLKNKSIITVIVSLVFLGAYYLLSSRVQNMVTDLVAQATAIGESIKGAAYGLYTWGSVGAGDWTATAIFLAATALLFALTWLILSKSFIAIATAGGTGARKVYKAKTVRQKTLFQSVLAKEMKRFTSNATYMLNCGLGIILIPALCVLMVIKRGDLPDIIALFSGSVSGIAQVLFCSVLFMLTAMINIAAPSVSLEGKAVWILQSMPIPGKTILRAKMSLQLFLSAIPTLLAAVCGAIILPDLTAMETLLICLLPLAFTFFVSAFDTVLGVRMANLMWTNEVYPIKQGGAVTIGLFGGWGVAIAFGGLYFLVCSVMNAETYLAIWTLLFAAIGGVLTKYLDTKGSKIFMALKG